MRPPPIHTRTHLSLGVGIDPHPSTVGKRLQLGSQLGAMETWLLLRSLRTLHLRGTPSADAIRRNVVVSRRKRGAHRSKPCS